MRSCSVFNVFFLSSRFAIAVSYCAVSASILPCEAARLSDVKPWITPAAFAIAAFSLPFCQFLIPASIPPRTTVDTAKPTIPGTVPTPVADAPKDATVPAFLAALTAFTAVARPPPALRAADTSAIIFATPIPDFAAMIPPPTNPAPS